jgi:flavin reductase (DIM6/NTAB) family NADH-FMN oxidoreductase RutF
MLQIPIEKAARLLYPSPVLLVSTRFREKTNLAPLTLYSILSWNPLMIGISLKPSSTTCKLIRQSGDFVLSIPDGSLLSEIHFCGTTKGKDRQKLRETNLLTRAARMVGPYVPAQVLAALECDVVDMKMIGDCRHIIAKVVSAESEVGVFDGEWKAENARFIHHLGGSRYLCEGRVFHAPDHGNQPLPEFEIE